MNEKKHSTRYHVAPETTMSNNRGSTDLDILPQLLPWDSWVLSSQRRNHRCGLPRLTRTPQRGNALPQNIIRCMKVAVVVPAADGANPFPVIQRKSFVDMSTFAQSGRREESVNLQHIDAISTSEVFQLFHKVSMREVFHLTAPQFLHSFKFQVFYADIIVFPAKLVCYLPLPVVAFICDALFKAGFGCCSLMAMIATFFAAGYPTVSAFLLSHGMFKEQRRLNALPVRESHISSQPEVDANGCTIMCLSYRLHFVVDEENNIILTGGCPVHTDTLNLANAFVWAREREFETLVYLVNGENIPVQTVSPLSEYKCSELLGLLKFRWASLYPFEEKLPRYFKPVKHLLHGLGSNPVAYAVPFRPFLFEPGDINVFVVYLIVSFMQCQSMVPYPARLAQHRVDMLCLLRAVKFILICYHALATNMGQHCALTWPSKQSHRDLSATRHGYCPNGVRSLMSGYKNSRTAAATLVPLRSFVGAKITRIF